MGAHLSQPAPPLDAAAVRPPRAVRTARVSTADAHRFAAEDLDDAIRDAGRPSNSSVGDAMGVDESFVRELRDPDGTRHATVARIYQVPDAVCDAWLRRILARRAALYGDPVRSSLTQQGRVAIGSMSRVIGSINGSTLDNEYSAEEAMHDAAEARAAVRDLERFIERADRISKGNAP